MTKFTAKTGRLDDDPDTANRSFEAQVRFGWMWLDRADQYRRAAHILWQIESQELRTAMTPSPPHRPADPRRTGVDYPSVTCMAVAIENVLKGVVAGDKSVKAVKSNKKSVEKLGSEIAGHDLLTLYKSTGLPPLKDSDEEGVLKVLGAYAEGYGRYPVGASSQRVLKASGYTGALAAIFDRLYLRFAEELLRRHNPAGASATIPDHGKVQLDLKEWIDWRLYKRIPDRLANLGPTQ